MRETVRAFTLIEMMVSITIFAIVMMVAVGALLALVGTNERAQAIHSVMNNLNAALDDMSRSIRVGTTYHCAAIATDLSNIDTPADCAMGGGKLLSFESATGNTALSTDQIVYRLNGTQLERSLTSGSINSWVAITAPEVSITTFDFYVVGSTQGDVVQPRVLMRIKGSAKVPGGTSNFDVQASVVQRVLYI